MSKVEHKAVRENCLEEISLSAGIIKAMNIVTVKDGIPPHSGREKSEGNRGGSILRKGHKREVLGTKREYISVLQILAKT